MLDSMPDIATTQVAATASKLDRAGMAAIEVPVRFDSPDIGITSAMGLVDAYVSLDDPTSKGIHMSRLYLSLQRNLAEHTLDLSLLSKILSDFLDTHEGLSESAFVSVAYDHMLQRPALLTDNKGWRRYPVKISGERHGDQEKLQLEIDITYSSTCPCSAALARQVMQRKFADDFDRSESIAKSDVLAWIEKNGTIATPHGQRSIAKVSVTPQSAQTVSILELINLLEDAVKTPVQAAVKRADEQEFARLNGANLMFSEDAARRIKAALEERSDLLDFSIKTSHYESLHPHDAVAYASKTHPIDATSTSRDSVTYQ